MINRHYLIFIVCLLLTILLPTQLKAEPNIPANPVQSMTFEYREHGYTLGDILTMQVNFSLKQGYQFDVNSVPLKGPMNAWLDLRQVSMNQTQHQVNLVLQYQFFGTVLDAQQVAIPAITLQTLPIKQDKNDVAKPLAITIPAQPVYLSPVLPSKLSENDTLRPILPPPAFDTTTPLSKALLSLLTAIALLLLTLWWQDRLAWLPRHPGPMTALSRQLKRQGITHQSSFTTSDLRLIHQGLADSAGQSLYPNTLDSLFNNAPYLLDEQQTISQFFHDSWQRIHSQQADNVSINVADTVAWIKRAAMQERIFKRSSPLAKTTS